ncbi:TPA: CDP-glycerol glycerophosphotransferase family protein [Escherichia coli]
MHNLFLIILRNKKTDELLSEKEKIIIKEKLINILTSIGDESLRAFSAKNYNHVHKIGYLKLIGIVAEKELCYIEDVNSSKNSIKLKIASQFDTLPKLTLNKKIVIPFTAKIKELTIFDINFAYEIYLWFGFKSQHQELSIKNNIKTEIIALGKRFDKLKLETAINSFERKNKITNMLPIKTKLLRYVSTLPFVAKKFEKAWLFIDNEIRADDNAEHFYRYVSKVHPKGKIYFLLNKKSADWKRLKNDGFKLIKFGGFFHRVLLINSQYLLSSHANPAIVNYLPRNHYSDIMKYKFVFLQHGITKDDQSEWLNSRKIDYLVTASTYEYEDISRRGRYRYTTQETVLTGFPRYDNLVKNTISKKQILIMPTWRKDLAGELQKKSSKRVKNPQFSNSIFCEMWGGFLRSDNLKKACFDKGYTVIFYPHPNLVDYIEDLNIPDYIKIGDLSTGSIQTAFKDADLLITDYSSVAFDIAYMKKPIIYFQFDSDTFFASHSYSKGYFDYYKLGFGPVVKDIEMLNTQLLSILDSNCVISPYYEERIDNFFPYNDRDNSSRLYEILSHAITQSYDVNTLLDYLHLFTHQLDINSIIFIFNTFSVELNSIPTNYHERLLGIFEGLDFINIEIECSEFTKEITSLSNSLSIRIAPKENLKKFNVGDDLSCYSNWIGRKQEKLMRAFQSPENSRLINYINSIKIFLSNYTKHAYSQAVLIYEKELLSYKIPLSSRITKIYIISLVRSDKINAAINIIKKTQLDNIDKHKILMELYDYHAPIHKSALDIECLMPTDNGKKEALEAFLTLSKTIPNDFYLNFNNVNEMPYMVLEYYLNNLYYKKQYADFYSALNRTTNKEHYLDSIENTYRYLTTVFKLLGIDVFIKELFHKYGKENLVKSLDELFIKNNNSDVDVFYKIIEGLISEELFSFSCAELYGYILFFSQKKRRGLAKKLTILAFAKSHQDYYIEDMHWNGKNDYKTLLRAVSEFNEIMLDLERMN